MAVRSRRARRGAAGTGVQTIAPGCDLQILPRLNFTRDFVLSGSGAGAGWQRLDLLVPPALPLGDYYLQTGLRDPGAPHGFTLTQPLRVAVR